MNFPFGAPKLVLIIMLMPTSLGYQQEFIINDDAHFFSCCAARDLPAQPVSRHTRATKFAKSIRTAASVSQARIAGLALSGQATLASDDITCDSIFLLPTAATGRPHFTLHQCHALIVHCQYPPELGLHFWLKLCYLEWNHR